MLRILTIGLLCTPRPFGVFANPFLGTWEAELVFNTDPLRLEFLDAQQIKITIKGDSITQGYRWNPNESRLNLGQVEGVELDSRYQLVGDGVFLLYFGATMKEALAGEMVFDVPETANQITQDFADLLIAGIMDSLDNIPILRAERVP